MASATGVWFEPNWPPGRNAGGLTCFADSLLVWAGGVKSIFCYDVNRWSEYSTLTARVAVYVYNIHAS
jgi:hypothetical protein